MILTERLPCQTSDGSGTMLPVDNNLSWKILVMLSIVYGAAFAVLAVADVSSKSMQIYATTGAILLGLGWAARAIFGNKSKSE